MKLAISGPDGSGKSSVCQLLSIKLDAKEVVYAGKRDFKLKSTLFAYKAWMFFKKFGSLGNFVGLYFIYYPLEYIENCIRFSRELNVDEVVIFDRHPVDRVMLYHELSIKKEKAKGLKYRVESFFRFIVSRMYLKFFPDIDRIYVLLPETQCFLIDQMVSIQV